MSASGRAAEELDQIEVLTVNTLVGVESVVGYDDQGSLRGQRTLLNRRPNLSQLCVQFFLNGEVRFTIVVVMRCMSEIRRHQFEIAKALIANALDEFAQHLTGNGTSQSKSFHCPF